MGKNIGIKIVLTIIITISYCRLLAQSSPVSAGGNDSSTIATIHYSIGQSFSQNYTINNLKINEGVQQPIEFYIKKIPTEDSTNNLDCKVYPNPFSNNITIEFTNTTDFISANCTIYDITGKCVFNQTITQLKNTINLQNLDHSLYFIHVQTIQKKDAINENVYKMIKIEH